MRRALTGVAILTALAHVYAQGSAHEVADREGADEVGEREEERGQRQRSSSRTSASRSVPR